MSGEITGIPALKIVYNDFDMSKGDELWHKR